MPATLALIASNGSLWQTGSAEMAARWKTVSGAGEHRGERGVADVDLMEAAEHLAVDQQVVAIAVLEVVDEMHVVAGAMQVQRELRADEAGRAGDDDLPAHAVPRESMMSNV